jgi:hypothetical protein
MAGGNGDDRQRAAWERVKGKPDHVSGITDRLDVL